MENSRNRNTEFLGVNKLGKNIRKSPLYQPNFGNDVARQPPSPPPAPPPPQVYNISKSDFRDIVQQLTGSPSHSQEFPPRPSQNSPKPQSLRLQKIRPPPLAGLNRPRVPAPVPANLAVAPRPLPQANVFPRPAQFAQPSAAPVQQLPPPGNSVVAESPVSAYMRYLQHFMLNPSPLGRQPLQPQSQPQPPPCLPPQPRVSENVQGPLPSSAAPNSHVSGFPSAGMSHPAPIWNGSFPSVPNLSTPHAYAASFLPSPTSQFLLPSPTSQFLLPSPNGYANLLSPRSSYPLLSPGALFPPVTPTFAFSPTAQPGIFGLGHPPPLSPHPPFPVSPSGFFSMRSPRWGNH